MNFDESIKIFELLSYIVTTIGLPFAIGTFIFQKRNEHKAEEENTFHQLDESYVSFLQLCLQHPDLDIFCPPIGNTYKPTEEQLRREHAVFGILISLFERAYFMFRDKSPEFRRSQWRGWVEYMECYSYRANFEREWNKIGSQFDKEFQTFMQNLVEKTKAADNAADAKKPRG
ncbi:MAG: hypothetical protein KKA54_09885 [Proteobacteria bacterium]|nr:hypothetical protein [Pseudomonadota bacterium]MBU0966677.1 hypothetical protein [Pseudomonadota bacterium]